jgi:polyphosphate glucokinase
MTPVFPVVFLLDIDNTLLDNDQIITDVRQYLTQAFGPEQQKRYWTIFDNLRAELGYADYLGALRRYRVQNSSDPHCVEFACYLLDYPFDSRLFPDSLKVIKRFSSWGPTVLLSDGDVVFQSRKAQQSGLYDAVERRALIYIHKEQHLVDIEKRFPAEDYVFVDDKLRVLAAVKHVWGSRLTSVFARQGHYAHDPQALANYPPADVTISRIGDLLRPELSSLITAAQSGNTVAKSPPTLQKHGAPLSHELHGRQVLVIDVGGTHVKILATGQAHHREFPSGPQLTPKEMVRKVRKVAGWSYDVVSIGYPGPVLRGKAVAEPHNLGSGWVGFDFEAAFGCPVKLINDAAMQALGSYERGRMLFLGLGTGLGSAMIVDGIVEPMELGHLPYRKGTFEDYVGLRGLKRFGKGKWRRYVDDVVARLSAALEPDYVVLGGGNVHKLKELPQNCRIGENANAFRGGFRLWKEPSERKARANNQLDITFTPFVPEPLKTQGHNHNQLEPIKASAGAQP